MKQMLILSLLLLIACAHHDDVRPGVSGVHYVTLQADDTASATRSALSQARHFCEQRAKDVAIISETKKYTGSMDENSYRNAKKLSRAAEVLGGVTAGVGSRRSTRRAGGTVGLGGVVADTALGDGYIVQLKFQCL